MAGRPGGRRKAGVAGAAKVLAALAALALAGCSLFQISDDYGNRYGGFFDYGNQYAWQRTKCANELISAKVAEPARKRWMECCMWRNAVPIGDSTGCEAPPYDKG